MKYFTVAFFAVWSLSAFAEKPQSVEIRFCPASAVRTYPLESRRDLQSLLLQNVAVINHGSAPFKIENIEIELLRSNRVIESRNVDREAVQRIADRGAKLQAAGILQQVGFQFCGTDLIAPSITLAGATLARDQALLIASQVLVFNGARDTLRVRVHGNFDGHAANSRVQSRSNLNLQRISTSFRYAVFGTLATELRFTQVIGGPFRKSLHSTLRRSVRADSATKAMVHDSMIITPTARMCSPRPTAM